MVRNSAGFRPGLKSTSQPRSEKISTARGLSSSEIRTLGFAIFSLDLCIGPVEPGQQGQKVALFHRSATPDAQARRGVAIGADVVACLLALQEVGDLLGGSCLLVSRQPGKPRCGDVEAYRGVGAGRLVLGEE